MTSDALALHSVDVVDVVAFLVGRPLGALLAPVSAAACCVSF